MALDRPEGAVSAAEQRMSEIPDATEHAALVCDGHIGLRQGKAGSPPFTQDHCTDLESTAPSPLEHFAPSRDLHVEVLRSKPE
jgi:hypothetical protein